MLVQLVVERLRLWAFQFQCKYKTTALSHLLNGAFMYFKFKSLWKSSDNWKRFESENLSKISRKTVNCATYLSHLLSATSELLSLIDSSCLWNQFACSKNKCIAKQWLCDGEDDCGDGVDESDDLCGAHYNTYTYVIDEWFQILTKKEHPKYSVNEMQPFWLTW